MISDFGTTANGGKNDGINIATAMDAPIHASASGTVTYAGDELKNYGNLVLIKHAAASPPLTPMPTGWWYRAAMW